jgi:pilus assembly protein CpaF
MKMRPERILLGEARGPEVLDFLQAINTGHDGSLFTIHANTPRDALARLEVMATMGGLDVPVRTIREQMSAAIDIIVQQMRLRDGKRKILSVTEVTGMQGEVVAMQDIFEFVQTDVKDGKIIGEFVATGNKPRCLDRLADEGFEFPEDFFQPPAGFEYPTPDLPPLPQL